MNKLMDKIRNSSWGCLMHNCSRSFVRGMGALAWPLILVVLFVKLSDAESQVDIRISGPQAGIPIAIPQLCNEHGAEPYDVQIGDLIARDLDLSGIFKVLPKESYIETPGKCVDPNNVSFTDWSPIGADGLVRGSIRALGPESYGAELYLFDVSRQKMVMGKRYTASGGDVRRIAHKFANEIMLFFTGELGVFGTKIAYTSRVGRFKELFVMNLDGSEVKKLTEDKGLVVSPRWSPRGDRIAYTSYRTKAPDIYTILPEGGTPQQVTSSQSLELGAVFLPDGSGMLASSSASGISNLVLFDMKGRLLRQVTSGASIDVSPSFSPDGSQFTFCSNRSGGPQIYVMSLNGGTARRISFTDSTYCTSPSWSPKGDQIAFVCRKGGNQLFVTSPDGTNPIQLTFDGNNEDPSFAPDGRYLVFSTTALGGGRNIAIVSLSTGRLKGLTTGRSEYAQPVWSPRID